jgi:YopX protein
MPASGYRIWITKSRQMCPVTHVELDPEGTHPFLYAEFLFTRPHGPVKHAACSYRDGVLMAATGIADRYGVDIFEGDILNVRGRGQWGEPAVVVRDQRRGFVYAFAGQADEPVALQPGADIEVVGNRHEHPALLR